MPFAALIGVGGPAGRVVVPGLMAARAAGATWWRRRVR